MAAIGGFVNGGLSLVKTVQRKLLGDLEGDFSSDLSYSDDTCISPMCLMQKHGRGGGGGGGGGG